MPDSLFTRVRAALLDRAATLTPQVDAARRYARDVLGFAPDRDGVTALLLAPTPGRGEQVRLRRTTRDVTYSFTLALVDAANGSLAVADPNPPAASAGDGDWRHNWRERVRDDLNGKRLSAAAEVQRVSLDEGTILDLTAWTQANLWWAVLSFSVLTRTART